MKTDTRRLALSLAAVLAAGAGASAAPSMPNEFENAGDALQRMFAYFGGVSSWSTSISTRRVHSGNSMRVDIAFQPDPNFPRAGVGIGSFGTAAPQLNIAPGADHLSVTIEAPTNGTLNFSIALREDDNNDGVINVNDGDDQWEIDPIVLQPGRRVYNIPVSQLLLANPGEGNGVQNFSTTPRMGYVLTFETRAEYAGGQVTWPVTAYVDHLGLYVGAQTLPSQVPGDVNGDGVVNFSDLNLVLSNFGQSGANIPGDANGDGVVNFTDLNIVLSNFGQGS